MPFRVSQELRTRGRGMKVSGRHTPILPNICSTNKRPARFVCMVKFVHLTQKWGEKTMRHSILHIHANVAAPGHRS